MFGVFQERLKKEKEQGDFKVQKDCPLSEYLQNIVKGQGVNLKNACNTGVKIRKEIEQGGGYGRPEMLNKLETLAKNKKTSNVENYEDWFDGCGAVSYFYVKEGESIAQYFEKYGLKIKKQTNYPRDVCGYGENLHVKYKWN